MEERIRFISHKGKKILLVDCTNCSSEELEKFAKIVPSHVTAEPRGSVLLLADFTGVKFDKKIVEHIKPALVYDRPHLKRSAWVAAETLPKIFHQHLKIFSQRDLPVFKTRQEALDWLVED
jgi:hypothetical protein